MGRAQAVQIHIGMTCLVAPHRPRAEVSAFPTRSFVSRRKIAFCNSGQSTAPLPCEAWHVRFDPSVSFLSVLSALSRSVMLRAEVAARVARGFPSTQLLNVRWASGAEKQASAWKISQPLTDRDHTSKWLQAARLSTAQTRLREEDAFSALINVCSGFLLYWRMPSRPKLLARSFGKLSEGKVNTGLLHPVLHLKPCLPGR